MSATMLQLVAQAIFDSVFPRSEGRPIPAGLLPAYLAMAHAAIEAMRDPTKSMIDAGHWAMDPNDEYLPADAAAQGWRAMIDEALR